MINEAIQFAAKAHAGAYRKGTNLPYIFHPLEALTIAMVLSDDEAVHAAAVLHDTIEDAGVTYEDIKKAFGQKVADIVKAESEDKSKSWEERKTYTLNTLKDESTEVKIVALADKLSNMRAISRDYYQLKDSLWERFNVKDKAKQGWYYKGILKALEEDFGNTYEWLELKTLTERVFD